MSTDEEPKEPIRIISDGFTQGPDSPTDSYRISNDAYRLLAFLGASLDPFRDGPPEDIGNLMTGVDAGTAFAELCQHDPPLLTRHKTTDTSFTIGLSPEGWTFYYRHIAIAGD